MHCTWSTLEDGTRALVCGGRRYESKRCKCGAEVAFLCDWKIQDARPPALKRAIRQPNTCSEPLCSNCAFSPAANKHLCLAHKNAWLLHPKHPRQQQADDQEAAHDSRY